MKTKETRALSRKIAEECKEHISRSLVMCKIGNVFYEPGYRNDIVRIKDCLPHHRKLIEASKKITSLYDHLPEEVWKRYQRYAEEKEFRDNCEELIRLIRHKKSFLVLWRARPTLLRKTKPC